MSVNYTSTPFRADPYVIPLDLNLLGKVLSIKQQKFDENAKNIQQGVNKLGALDILRPIDKQYADQKVNDLVKNVNNLGGVDLSDANISNQIESLGTDIYNDPNVINAVSGTKAIRTLQDSYNKFKTDPKFNKLYSPVNEAWDMRDVQTYLTSDKLGETYHGGSSPTPYVNYKENLLKNLQTVKARLEESITPNGPLYYDKETHAKISPSQIIQAATDLSTPEEVAQMKRDGWYQYRNTDPITLVNKAIEVNNFKLTDAIGTLQEYKTKYLTSTSDPVAKQNYEFLIKQQQAEVDALSKASDPSFYAAKYKADPTTFAQNVYMDEFYRGLGSRFAQNETKRSLIPNTAEMFNLRMAQAERFHKDEMKMKEEELAAKGLKRDANGNIVKNTDANFTFTPPNTADPNATPTGESAYVQKNKEIKDENTALWQNFFAQWANDNPEVKNVLQSETTGTGINVGLQHQDIIAGADQILQIEDFNVPVGSEKYTKAKAAGLTDAQLGLIHNLYLQYEQAATGSEHGISSFPKGLENVVEQMQLNNGTYRANEKKMQEINAVLSQRYGVSPADLDYFKKFEDMVSRDRQAGDLYYNSIAGKAPGVLPNSTALGNVLNTLYRGFSELVGDNAGSHTLVRPEEQTYFTKEGKQRLSKILQTVKSASFEKDKNTLYAQTENRPVYKTPIMGEGYLGRVGLEDAKTLAAQIMHDKGDFEGKNQTDVPVDNIKIIGAGRGYGDSKYTLTVQVIDGKKVSERILALDPDQAKRFGFIESPYDRVNDEVILNGSSSPYLISANLNRNIPDRKAPLRAKIVIVHDNPNSRDDLSSHAYIVDKEGKKVANIPNTTGLRPDEAYARAKAFVQACEIEGLTYDQMVQKIVKDSY